MPRRKIEREWTRTPSGWCLTPGWKRLAVAVERCHEVEATGRASGVEPAQLEDGMYTVSAKRLLVGGRWQ